MGTSLGDKINIYPVKGYSITIDLNDTLSKESAPEVSLDDGAKIVSSRLGEDRFRIAGTAEFNGYNKDILQNRRIDPLIKWCNQLFPNVSTEFYRPWTGLRPMTPSMMPRIGRGKLPGIFYNTGHGHLGWTLSAFRHYLLQI